MIARKLYYSLSPKMRRVTRRWVYFPIDIFELLTGKSNPMVPPKGMIFTGSGDFLQSGKALLQLCIDYANLKPNGALLDVGCGIGRLAIPLTQYLTPNGKYEGFDVVPDGINWCKEKVSSKYPYFNFTFTPLRNDLYNLDTKQEAHQFVFPYADNTFDVVVLTSVFTHMQPNEVQHYLQQIKRVLKPGGHCLSTFFIMDKNTQEILKQNKELMQFSFEYDTHYLHDNKVKDANIAFKKTAIQNMASNANLNIKLLNNGWWKGGDKSASLNYQDLVVFTA
jgi:ubiquinone/menaquinone biosynthesis C-methylase UbiE